MKVSEITTQAVSDYLRLDEDDPALLTPILAAAKAFVKDYTGLEDEELDEYDSFFLAIMVLCQDMYDNRTLYVEKDHINRVVDSILYQHRRNFV